MYLKTFLCGISVIRTWAGKPSGLSARSMGQNIKVVPTSDLLEAHTVFSHPLMFEPPAWEPAVAWLWLECPPKVCCIGSHSRARGMM